MKLKDGFINCSGNTEQRPYLSLLLKAIQTSAPHINNFPFLLDSLQPPSVPPRVPPPLTLSSSRPRSRQAHRTFGDTPLRGRSSFGLEFKGSGGRGVVRVGRGSERVRAEATGLDTSPRSSFSLFPSISDFQNTCLTPDACQRQATRL